MDPITQQIIHYFQNNPPRPLLASDIAQALHLPNLDVSESLAAMLEQGYVYRAGDSPLRSYWYPTKYIMDRGKKVSTPNWLPLHSYQQHQTVLKNLTPENRESNYTKIQQEMDQYYPYFTQNHPEYKKLFQWLDRNIAHKKELLKDAAALFLRMNVSNPAIAYPNEKKYKIPDYLVTVENAMYESITRFINNMPDKRKEVLTQDEYYTAYNKVSQLTTKIQQKFIDEVVKVSPKGTVILNTVIEKFIEKDLSSIIPDKKHTDMFLGMVSNKLSTEAVDPVVYKVFFEDTPPLKIAEVIGGTLQTGVKVLSTFKNTSKSEKVIAQVYTHLFSGKDYTGYDLQGIDLSVTFSLEGSIFKGTNFNNSKWAGLAVSNCDFTKALITNSSFNPATFTSNIISKMDLLNSSVNKKIKWEDNPGTPLNLFIRDVDYDTPKLKEVLKSPGFSFSSVPLKDEELEDAKVVALALKKFLDGKNLIASKTLQLLKLSALDKNVINQLKNWLSDEVQQVPDFMTTEDLKTFLIDKSKTGELAQAGFSPKDISILFKRSRELVDPRASRQSPEEKQKQERDKKINQFITAYQGQDSLPSNALSSLLTYKKGNLQDWFSSFNKDLSYADLQKIYHSLISSIKNFHINPYVKPIRSYQAFPHTTHMHPLKSQGKDFEWSDDHRKKLFAITLTPDLSSMPKDVAKSTYRTITYGGGHLQNAVCYARIAPMSYTLTSMKGKPLNKYIWFIVEMQADPYQHAFGSQWEGYKKVLGDSPPKRSEEELTAEIEQKFTGTTKNKYLGNLAVYEAVSDFRKYFSHWPENLMNSIITLAGENNVDEIWMPKGTDVEANVGSGADWTYNYDRPAKVFGGQLKDVGVKVLLDPGFTQYKDKVSNVYVIEIPKGGGLKLDWQENPAVTEDGYFKSRKKHAISPLPEWQKYFDFFDDLMHGTKEGNTIGGFIDMAFPELGGKGELVKEIYEAWLNAETIDRTPSLKLDWATDPEDTAEAIADRTGGAYSFERYQMPYWLRLTQHLLDLGFTPEETEQFLWTKESRVQADSANFDNREMEGRQQPEITESNFNALLDYIASDKHLIIGRMRHSIDQSFKAGDDTNFYTSKRLHNRPINSSLKLDWDPTNSVLDTIYWRNFIRVFIASYVQKRIELGEPNREMLITEATTAVLKEIPDDVKETYEFNAVLQDIVDELKNEYGQSFEDLMISETSLKLNWADIEDDRVYDDKAIEDAVNFYKQFLIDHEDRIRHLYDTKWYRNGGWNGMMDALSQVEKETIGLRSALKNATEILSEEGLWEKVINSVLFPLHNASLKLNWVPGDPETPIEKKQRLLTIVKHPEYYNYTLTGGNVWQMSEYDKALEELKDEFGIDISEPDYITKEDALTIHHPKHVHNVFKAPNGKYNPGWAGGPWDATSQKAVLRSAGGMIRANEKALETGVAVQMYDAFHHAYPDHGEGFCVLNDIAIAAKKLSTQNKKVMIVDTDVHQGQGTAVCLAGDANVYTLSTHASNLYPYDKEKSNLDIELKDKITDQEYLTLLEGALNRAFSEFQPDLVMYVAGTDLYGKDQLSNTRVTLEGIQRRDQLVFKFFGEKGIPISTSIPQGYAREAADSRTMIKNTLREANKALMYYDKRASLKLDWDLDVEDEFENQEYRLPEQIKNDEKLERKLRQLGISFKETYLNTDPPTRVLEIENRAGKKIQVGYDRWGYVTEGAVELDQESFPVTINSIKRFLNGRNASLKLDWADIVSEYSEEYFRNLFQNALLDTATVDLIGSYIYEDKAAALADIKEDVLLYRGTRKKVLQNFIDLIDKYGEDADFQNALKKASKKYFTWKFRNNRRSSLKLDWGLEPAPFNIGDRIKLLKNIITMVGEYFEGEEGIIVEEVHEDLFTVQFEKGYVNVFDSDMEKIPDSLKLDWANVQETLKVGDKIKIINNKFLIDPKTIPIGTLGEVGEIFPRVIWRGIKETDSKGWISLRIILNRQYYFSGCPLTNWNKYLEKVN